MKEETKKIVSWIKHKLPQITNDDDHYKQWKKAVDFLNSLPEIENKLCFGGYLQDKNGILCCHGDKIININLRNREKEVGTLYWSSNDYCFYCKDENGKVHTLSRGFSKVEK